MNISALELLFMFGNDADVVRFTISEEPLLFGVEKVRLLSIPLPKSM
jgi:hypothetical protein